MSRILPSFGTGRWRRPWFVNCSQGSSPPQPLGQTLNSPSQKAFETAPLDLVIRITVGRNPYYELEPALIKGLQGNFDVRNRLYRFCSWVVSVFECCGICPVLDHAQPLSRELLFFTVFFHLLTGCIESKRNERYRVRVLCFLMKKQTRPQSKIVRPVLV